MSFAFGVVAGHDRIRGPSYVEEWFASLLHVSETLVTLDYRGLVSEGTGGADLGFFYPLFWLPMDAYCVGVDSGYVFPDHGAGNYSLEWLFA